MAPTWVVPIATHLLFFVFRTLSAPIRSFVAHCIRTNPNNVCGSVWDCEPRTQSPTTTTSVQGRLISGDPQLFRRPTVRRFFFSFFLVSFFLRQLFFFAFSSLLKCSSSGILFMLVLCFSEISVFHLNSVFFY